MKRNLTIFSLIVFFIALMNCENNSTKPEPVELTLLTPVGGDVWLIGADVDITWSAENAGSTINIEVSQDNGESWDLIAETANSGSYTWTVESEPNNVLLRVTDVESGVTASHDEPIAIRTLGTFGIDFYLEYVAEPYPTYQTVMWLDDENGNFVQSLFVSDWLYRGGYNSRYVCPTWAGKANWTDDNIEDIDGLTGPTPDWGVDSNYEFELKERGLAPGTYKFNIETHITNDYNILYTGDMEIQAEDNDNEPTPVFLPEQHPQAGLVLKNVKMKYVLISKILVIIVFNMKTQMNSEVTR